VEPEKTLVTGGVRSGKSRYAEELLAAHEHVTYLAPGPAPDLTADPEWAARIAVHQARRPAHWRTVETARLDETLGTSKPPLLVDSLGSWLTAVVDELGTWDIPLADWQHTFDERLEQLVRAWVAVPGPAVAVTNEVGWGLVAEHRSGRIFADLLGRTNQAVAAVSDHVVLVVAGRALHL
jgi:adenosylcobinamide kinase/adenosylcobinamide-phosphate guanylyltransferase